MLGNKQEREVSGGFFRLVDLISSCAFEISYLWSGEASFQEEQTAVSVLVARLWVCRAGLRLAGQELFVPSSS